MDDSSDQQYLIIPPCYIKEELDISYVTDYSDEEMINDECDEPVEKLDNTDKQTVNSESNSTNASQELITNDGGNQTLNSTKNEENNTNNMKVNGSISIIKRESDDTEVDVENDSLSSDDEIDNGPNIQESSSEEDFELKVSDESGDKTTSDGVDNCQNDKNVTTVQPDKLTSKENNSDFVIKTYKTRNKSKNAIPTENLNSVNFNKTLNKLDNSEDKTVNKIVTRQSFKTNENPPVQIRQSRKAFMKKDTTLFCVKCNVDCDFLHVNRHKSKCHLCQSVLRYKCLLCNDKICISYGGLSKHIRVHHIFKSSSKKFKRNKIVKTENIISKPKVDNLELVTTDIDKFTVLICQVCNNTNRIHNGEIAVCEQCNIKMILTCLICGKFDAAINGMYDHLHKQHQEHFLQDHVETNNVDLNHSSPVENKNNKLFHSYIRGKKCLNCNKKFLHITSAMSHSKYCGKEPNMQCSFCNFKTKYIANLKKHVEQLHNKPFIKDVSYNDSNCKTTKKSAYSNRCPKCNKTFSILKRLTYHMKYCGLELKFQCQFCTYKTKFKHNLKSHLIQVHRISNNLIKETVQSTSVDIQNGVTSSNIESINATNETDTSITVEPKKINLNNMMRAYCNNCHEKQKVVSTCKGRECRKCKTELLYQCKKCNKEYNRYSSMAYHIKYQCGRKTYYQCYKCDYKTTDKYFIHKHARSHGFTQKAFLNPSRSRAYKMIRDSKKEFSDSQTEKTSELNELNENFNEQKLDYTDELAELQEHSKFPKPERISDQDIETSEKQQISTETDHQNIENSKVTCARCNARVRNLVKHSKYCGMEANIKCRFCPYKTKYSGNMKTHIKNVHRSKKNKYNAKLLDKTDVHNGQEVVHSTKICKSKETVQLTAEDLMEVYCLKCNKSKTEIKYASKCRVCDSELTFRCGKCNGEYPTREALRIHVRKHWHSFKCEKCSKAFNSKVNLCMHEKMCTARAESPRLSKQHPDLPQLEE